MDADKKILGHWHLIRILGSGGFGQVSLWCENSTGQKIAIKKMLDVALKDTSVKAKLVERWCKEVEIMKKLNHINIVGTLKIPSEFDVIEPLPILAMEYCTNGDLRQVLNKAENCCGLPELEILNILRDVSNGLAYLHSCKIIHRDIKPDNIVLQETGSKIIYKLIDLGYAKAFDQSSLSKSFVGTIQYIAPELFFGKLYTSSVDYWSFGIMTHEIITGYRPFLPGRSPSEWMKQIQNKGRNIVCVEENTSREIVFHEKISRQNHSSRCFLNDIEKWLQLALDWNGETRGRDSEKNRLIIFETLSRIICKKLIKIFSLPTFEILFYEIYDKTDVLDLKHWLKGKTHIGEEEQLLLFSSGKCLNTNGNLLKNLEHEVLDRSFVTLFLFNNTSPMNVKADEIQIPIFLDELRKTPNQTWSYRQLKKCYADMVYFLQSQATLYRYFLQGIKVKIANTKQKTLAVESLYENLASEWNRIEIYGHFLSLSHKVDLENYIYYRKAGKLKSSFFARKWIQNAIIINKNITELRSTFNKTKQRQLVFQAKERCRNLEDHAKGDDTKRISLDSLVEKGQKFWENLQNFRENDCENLTPSPSAAELINKASEETNKFLKCEVLKTLFIKIWEADENLSKFFSHLTNIYKSVNILKCLIQNTQVDRQKEVWSLIEKESLFKEQGDKSFSEDLKIPKCEKNKRNTCDFITTFVNSYSESESLVLEESEIKKNSLFSIGSIEASSMNINDSYSLIEDNNHLRYRIQEVQQTCNQMIKDFASLNWDFLEYS